MASFAAPGKKIPPKQGALVGKVARIVADNHYLCGFLIEIKSHEGSKVMGQTVHKPYLKDFIPSADKAPQQVACDEKDVLNLEEIGKTVLTVAKPLKFKDTDRADLEMRFDPEELQKFSSFDTDPRWAAIHLNMYWYLVVRDFELETDQSICWITCEQISSICHELDNEMGPECFVRVVSRFAAQLKDVKHIFVPIWGGTFGGGDQHWTWLYVHAKDDATHEACYKDSLTNLHRDCWENAEKILTCIAVAVNDHALKMPKDRANRMMQPKGSPLCGQFVAHWTEEKIREIMGEGANSIGHPNISRLNTRIAKMQHIIVANKGFAKIHHAKLEKIQEDLLKKKELEEKALQDLAADKEFLQKSKITAGLKILIPWATVAGCAKCRWKVEGSTCCNPYKILAKQRAVEEWQSKHDSKDDKFDKDNYNAHLQQIYKEIKAEHTAPLALPKIPEKGGGDRDCLVELDRYYYYYDY